MSAFPKESKKKEREKTKTDRIVPTIRVHSLHNYVALKHGSIVTVIIVRIVAPRVVKATAVTNPLEIHSTSLFIFLKSVGIAPSNVPATGQIMRADWTSGTVRVQFWRDVFGLDGFQQWRE